MRKNTEETNVRKVQFPIHLKQGNQEGLKTRLALVGHPFQKISGMYLLLRQLLINGHIKTQRLGINITDIDTTLLIK